MKSCKKPEKPEMANEKQNKKLAEALKSRWKIMEKHEKLDRNLGKDTKRSNPDRLIWHGTLSMF